MEQWVDIKNYEGYYQISNKGRVRSLSRNIIYSNGQNAVHRARIRKISSKTEYRLVLLSKDNKQTLLKVSRLVAQSFADNPKNYNVVNHKDGNKHNDTAENLEWVTYSENAVHAFEMGLNNKINKIAGIFYEKRRNKWACYLYRNNKNIFLGRYNTFELAKNVQDSHKANIC